MVGGVVGLGGTIAWCDYSASPIGEQISTKQYKQLKTLFSNDSRFIGWPSGLIRNSVSTLTIHFPEIVVNTQIQLFREALEPAIPDEKAFADTSWRNLALGKSRLLIQRPAQFSVGMFIVAAVCK